ncbi:hypothetical protein D3C78_1565160 [compost metagenome]
MSAVGGDQKITAGLAAVFKPGGNALRGFFNTANPFAEAHLVAAVGVQQHGLQLGARYRVRAFADAGD